MLTYMKYEIKGTYKFILGILALVLILITGLYAYTNNVEEVSAGGSFFTVLSVMILFGTGLTAFLYIVGSFRKELYEDRGYLTFTLPLTGNQIVGSKLIVALLWFFVLGMGIALYNLVMILSFSPVELNLSDIFSVIFQTASFVDLIVIAFTGILSGVNMLILIYFSMVLSRVTFRNKRIGALWFVIFLILSGILSFGQFEVAQLLPYYIDFNTFRVGTLDTISPSIGFAFGGAEFHGTETGMLTNIATFIYSIVTTVALFIGTGYFIEKKIDL